jgi:hypothetical protein
MDEPGIKLTIYFSERDRTGGRSLLTLAAAPHDQRYLELKTGACLRLPEVGEWARSRPETTAR